MSTSGGRLLLLAAVATALGAAVLVALPGESREPATGDVGGRAAGEAAPRAAVSPTLAGALPASAGEARDDVGCILRGVVLGPQGPQVASLVLRRVRGGPVGQARGWHRVDRRESSLAVPEAGSRVEASVSTAADGAFEFRGLAPGGYVVEAEAPDGLAGSGFAAFDLPRAVCHLTLRLEPATERVVGRARWASGAPFVGVVRASDDGRPFTARSGRQAGFSRVTSTSSDGSFAFAGLPRGNLALTAIVEGTWRSWPLWIALPRSDPVEFVVDGGGHVLGGRVLDASSDAPIEGARVRIEGYGQHGAAGAAAVSGADGGFSVPWGYDATAWVLVEAPGYARRVWTEVPCGTPYGLRLQRAARLGGRVTDPSGAPVAGLSLELLDCDVADAAVTDAGGRYAFADLPEGEVRVTTFGEGWVPRGMGRQDGSGSEASFDATSAVLAAGETTTLDLVVERGASVRGRLRQADGSAAAGVGVHLHRASDDPRCEGVERASALWVTDEQGGFEMAGLLPGVGYTLLAWGPGDAAVEAGVKPPSPPEVGEIELRLPAATLWRVQVRDAVSGAPIPGARVGEATTDRDGRATLGPRNARSTYVQVWAQGYLPKHGCGLVRDGLDGVASVTLQPARRLRGRVVFPDGRGVQAVFELKATAEGEAWGGSRAWTDDAGRFERDVPAGVDVAVTADRSTEGFEWSASASVSPSQADVVLTLVAGDALSSERERAERFPLRVLDPAGRPVPSFKLDGALQARDQEGREPGVTWLDGRPSPGSEITVHDARDAEGRSMGLAAYCTGPLAEMGQELAIRLEPERLLVGSVVDGEGNAVAGVGVHAVPARRDVDPSVSSRSDFVLATGRTDATGRFRLRGLASEPYVLTLGLPVGRFAPRRILVEADQDEVEIALRAAVNARVQVRDRRGAPRAGLRVTASLERVEHSWRWGPMTSQETKADAVTDAAGIALLAGLDPAEPHLLRVRASRDQDASWELGDLFAGGNDGVDLDRWRPADVTLVFAPRTRVNGTVCDAHGRPVAGATVYWSADGGAWVAERTWGDTDFWLTVPADAARVVLAATASEQEAPGPGAPRVFVAPGARDVSLTVDLGLTLAVTVDRTPIDAQFWDGSAPCNPAVLVPEGADPALRPLRTEGHASFEFRGLARDASYTLWIFGGRDQRIACVRGVRSAHSPLSLTLEEGREITGRVIRPSGAVRLRVTATCEVPGLLASATVGPDGTFSLRGLLDLPWTVVATGEDDHGDFEASAVAEPGASLRLDLRGKSAPGGGARR